MPSLIVEARPPEVRWGVAFRRMAEYLAAGVAVVVIMDIVEAAAAVYRCDEPPQVFHNGEVLTLPDLLPGFSAPVEDFFGEAPHAYNGEVG